MTTYDVDFRPGRRNEIPSYVSIPKAVVQNPSVGECSVDT